MNNMTDDALIGLIFGFVIFFLDLILFCIFVSRVRVSFNKAYHVDDEWSQMNDYWLKLSRVSGVMFCLFHLGIMIIVLIESMYIENVVNISEHLTNSILDNNIIAHSYWILQSLWILMVNLAIVLITQRMYRVYKTTSTPFTPLKDWMSNHQKLIEYVIWTIYVLITFTIIAQYVFILYDYNIKFINYDQIIILSIINASRNFLSAIILFMQLIIAMFFSYIAHKSQKQTNWNEQSKAIICKETAKLAFIVFFLAVIVGVILYTAIWYILNLNNKITLNQPFNDTNKRIFWSILEFLGFWLVLYLTRLRKPPSDQDYLEKEIPSSTTTRSKLFLKRTLSSKQRKLQLKQMKLKQLEERKKAFQKREEKRISKYNLNIKPKPKNNDQAFNAIFINQVAKYEKEKKLKLQQQQQENNNNEEEKNQQNQPEIKTEQEVIHQISPKLEAQHKRKRYPSATLNLIEERNNSDSLRQCAIKKDIDIDIYLKSLQSANENTDLVYGSSADSQPPTEMTSLKKRITVNSNSTCTTIDTILNNSDGLIMNDSEYESCDDYGVTPFVNTDHLPLQRIETGPMKNYKNPNPSPASTIITMSGNKANSPFTPISTSKTLSEPKPNGKKKKNNTNYSTLDLQQIANISSAETDVPSPIDIKKNKNDEATPIPNSKSNHNENENENDLLTKSLSAANIFTPTINSKNSMNISMTANTLSSPTQKYASLTPNHSYHHTKNASKHFTTPVSVVFTPATRNRNTSNQNKDTSSKYSIGLNDALSQAIHEEESLERLWAQKTPTNGISIMEHHHQNDNHNHNQHDDDDDDDDDEEEETMEDEDDSGEFVDVCDISDIEEEEETMEDEHDDDDDDDDIDSSDTETYDEDEKNEGSIKMFDPQNADDIPHVLESKTPQPRGWGLRLFQTNSGKSDRSETKRYEKRNEKRDSITGIGFKKMLAKIGAAFTPHPEKSDNKSFDFDETANDDDDDDIKHDINDIIDDNMDIVSSDLIETQKAIQQRKSEMHGKSLRNDKSATSKMSSTKTKTLTFREGNYYHSDELDSFPHVRVSDKQHHDKSGFILQFESTAPTYGKSSAVISTRPATTTHTPQSDDTMAGSPTDTMTNTATSTTITNTNTATTKTVTMTGNGINELSKFNVNTDAMKSSKGIDLISLNENRSYDDITVYNEGSEPEPDHTDNDEEEKDDHDDDDDDDDLSIVIHGINENPNNDIKRAGTMDLTVEEKQDILAEILNNEIICEHEHTLTAVQDITDIIADAFKDNEEEIEHQSVHSVHTHQSFETSITREATDRIASLPKTKRFNPGMVNLSSVQEDKQKDAVLYKDDEKQIEELPSLPPSPFKNGREHTNKQESGDMSKYIKEREDGNGGGLFHNIHLKPTVLKRSHSDPDIRVRDKIWDQLLTAFKQMNNMDDMKHNDIDNNNNNNNNNDLTMSPQPKPELSHRESRRGSITSKFTDFSDYYHIQTPIQTPMGSIGTLGSRMASHRDDSFIYTDDEMSHISHISHNTQLSYAALPEDNKGFNLFGWFHKNPHKASIHIDHNKKNKNKNKNKNKTKLKPASININTVPSNDDIMSDDSIADFNYIEENMSDIEILEEIKSQQQKKKKKKKKRSKEIWQNLVKRNHHHSAHQDSLELPKSDLPPFEDWNKTNTKQQQPTSIRLNENENNNKKKQKKRIKKKMTMDPHTNTENHKGTKVSRQKSKSYSRKKRQRGNSKVRQIAAKIDENGKFDGEKPTITTKLKATENNKSRKRKKLKSRLKRKKQTKQFLINVHQVF